MKKINFFNRHLNDTGENFFEHFLFAFTTGLWLTWCGIMLILHSVLPFYFVHNTSSNVKKINQMMQKRVEMLRARKNGEDVKNIL